MDSLAHAPTSPLAAPKSRANWALYGIEGTLVAVLLLATCSIVAVLDHPSSPLAGLLPAGVVHRATAGLLIAATVICIVYSPLGRRTGPHLNPAMTLTFLRLGRISAADAAGFIAGQFIGAATGVAIAAVLLRPFARETHFAVNVPGGFGLAAAWLAEFAIAMLLVCVVFTVNRTRLVKFTGCFAAALTWAFITFESPISGTGVNAARTFASSLFANIWTGWWIYFTAPPLGMLAGVEILRWMGRAHQSLCGKLTHAPISFFKCNCLTPLEGKP